ncbi:hypothetical protein JW859_00490 [bacterium]|nr:hypothetical protein [bacterium]
MRSAPRGAGGSWQAPPGRLARSGFSNAALAALIGLVALVGLLGLMSSGQVDFASLFAPPPEVKTEKAKKKKTAPPALVPPEAVIPIAPEITAPDAAEPAADRYELDPQLELVQALGRMDGQAAAEMLSFTAPETATRLLLQLRERDLARILEYAPAADAAQWVESIEAAVDLAEAQRRTALAAAAQAEPAADTAADAAAENPDGTPPATEATDDTAAVDSTEDTGATAESAPADEAEAASAGGQPEPPPDTNTA